MKVQTVYNETNDELCLLTMTYNVYKTNEWH